MQITENMESNELSVSVVITTYSREVECKRAVESVVSQTFSPTEVLVVEDGSSSCIEAWLESQHPDIQYIAHETNRGLPAARNTGLLHASGEYVAYLDDDDVWKPSRLERQVEKITSLGSEQRRKTGVVYCSVERRWPDDTVHSIGYPVNEGNLADSIKNDGPSTLPSSFLFSRRSLEEIGGFDESLPSSIDHDIWMSLAVHGYSAVAIQEPLVITYKSDNQSMVTNTSPRLAGVLQFLNKWAPTFDSWYGKKEGKRFREKYFARVIAQLAASNLIAGDVLGALRAVRSIYQFSEQRIYNTSVLLLTVLTKFVDRKLPAPIPEILRQVVKVTKNVT
ncbi:glycosyltransferase involved in cell wall biosynthesis [Salinibacter ruber]|uniref:glycosyltransferase family 2 protein n=1 Tax=Salinibacter ruber TaxID=146919 RepID=UPI00216A6789|nr:glycosyltransferase family 2 protein [Salinibacter ruber]MCS3935204.1 glycosyltransferase involved in cell wall biosynthesis [Salinibacter ruber]MCS4043239.1 glycosyltransferase involved in cell wall biosynthesis [Salinibacter ruber]